MAQKIKTLITAPAYFDKDALALFQKIGDVTVKALSYNELLSSIAQYDVLAIRVDTKVDKKMLDAATKLKVIATATTGTDHIYVDYAKKKCIEVISLTGANTTATAEHVFALLLSLLRKVPAAHRSLSQGNWNRSAFIGTSLENKKLGIVGFGRIGQHVGRIAHGFGMKLLAYDPYLPDDVFAKTNAKKMELDALLQESDAVTLHMFLSDETKGMFNLKKFQLIKKTAFLVNCSRGEVIVERDLITALEQRYIAGAALDVFAQEPLAKSSPLLAYAQTHDNLLLTPHIAGSTGEAIHEAGIFVATKTKEYFDKKR
jgi:D-3-phosphoglycerate dehydrogenase